MSDDRSSAASGLQRGCLRGCVDALCESRHHRNGSARKPRSEPARLFETVGRWLPRPYNGDGALAERVEIAPNEENRSAIVSLAKVDRVAVIAHGYEAHIRM